MFRFRKRSKIHHRLIFAQKGSINSHLNFDQRMAIFVTEQVDPEITNSSGDDTNDGIMGKPQEFSKNGDCSERSIKGDELAEYNKARKQQVVWDEVELRWKKKRTPEEMASRRRKVIETLNKRRGAVCSEIERAWFVEGTHLEKHRHNLQVTHELTVRGLLVWW